MAHRLVVALLVSALSAACGTTRVVRLDTGQGTPLERGLPGSSRSVKVDSREFEETLTRWALNEPLVLRPSQPGGLVRASYPSNAPDTRWQRWVRKSFGGLCKPGQRREDCLSLLDDVMGMSERDKLGVALGMSLQPMKESISRAVENMLAPELFYTVIATSLTGWVVLAANPEPVFTKAAAIASAVLLIYLGVESFLEVLRASRELKWATDKATTPEELEQAGQRFASRVGPEVARVFVLAITVVVSHGMTEGSALLAARLSMLPSFSEAAAVGASGVGIQLANAGQVNAVAVATDGTITIALAPTAVAMVAANDGSGGSEQEESASGTNNYRETFFEAHPALRDRVIVHHAVEQQVLRRYPGLFTEREIHSLDNLRGIPKSSHPDIHLSKIRRAWNEFYRSHSRPTKQQILDFAAQLDRQFGALFEPPQ